MATLSFDIGIKNLAYCQAQDTHIEKLEVISLEYSKTCFEIVSRSLFNNLTQRFDQMNIKQVLIENQPVKINPVMKSLQMMIYSYFFIKGFPVKMVAAANKTSLLNKLSQPEIDRITAQLTLSSKYGNRKRLAVLLADYYLQNRDPEQHILFQKAKKKDDLADALLIHLNFHNAFQII